MIKFLISLFHRYVPFQRTDAQILRLQAAQRESRAIQLRKAMLASQVQATIRRIEGQANGH